MSYTVGETHARLTLTSVKPLLWTCECGRVIKATYHAVTQGRLRSCGCLLRSKAAVIRWDSLRLRPLQLINPEAKARQQVWRVQCLICEAEHDARRSALLVAVNQYGCRSCWHRNKAAGRTAEAPSYAALLRENARLKARLGGRDDGGA